jgi:hypothetical protein
MNSVSELRDWLANFPLDYGVAIDDGGLTLVVLDPSLDQVGYNEIGGLPRPEEDDTYENQN